MPQARQDGDQEATARARVERPEIDLATFRVLVSEGPDRGKSVTIGPQTTPKIFVGKSVACELALTDREVSRRHIALDLERDGLRITDLDSTNGTTVGGLAITSARLVGGERVRVGSTELVVELTSSKTTVRFPPVESFGRVLGASVAMRRLYPLLQKVAAADVPVLIEGETGTGKEILAESLHELGPRKGQPFVVFDWQAVDPKHVDAVLFGEHVRGRSGVKRTPGVFEEASGGTLLIDEIAEVPLVTQAKLLRVLESKEVRPVGGDRWLPVDARVIALTARDLERAVEGDKFREDLFYRLAVARVSLPPLRDRHGDVAVLAEHFWQRTGAALPMPSDLLSAYQGYAWPGNVRELANVVERRALLGMAAESAIVADGSAPIVPEQAFQRVLEMDLTLPQARERVVAAFERSYLERVLAKHAGNVTRAAAASGIARRYFHALRVRHRVK